MVNRSCIMCAATCNFIRRTSKYCRKCVSSIAAEANRTHGMTNTRSYNSWKDILVRARLTSIAIESSWSSFEAFQKDMGERPEEFYLYRIDWKKGYLKSNMKYGSRKEYVANRAMNMRVMFKDKKQIEASKSEYLCW